MNIFVAKLNFSTEEEDLRQCFEAYGDVDSVKIIMDRETGRSKGYGFVEMPDEEAGRQAIEDLNNSEFDGRTIVVKEAEVREKRNNFNRGGGGGYNRGGGGGGYNRGGGGGGYNRGGGGGGYNRGGGGGGYNRGGGGGNNYRSRNKNNDWNSSNDDY